MKRRLQTFALVGGVAAALVAYVAVRELVRLSIWYRDREHAREIPWPVRK